MHEKHDILQHWNIKIKKHEKRSLQEKKISFYAKNLGTILCFHII